MEASVKKSHVRTPEQRPCRQKYLKWVPVFGVLALTDVARLWSGEAAEILTHREALRDEVRRAYEQKRRTIQAASVRLVGPAETIFVPRRLVAAILYALRIEQPGHEFELEPDRSGPAGREFEKETVVEVCDRALGALDSR